MADHILLVGGDARSRSEISRDLRDRGYEVNAVPDGAEAQRALAAQPPDLILLEHPWSKDLGKALLERWTQAYPVLVVCAESGIDAALQVLRQGATEFLVKPLDREELADAIRRIIDNALLYQRGEFYTNVLRHRGAQPAGWGKRPAETSAGRTPGRGPQRGHGLDPG
jgi:DNA-binding NtrC family response regulator